jgi:class 3 adenylate cyclase
VTYAENARGLNRSEGPPFEVARGSAYTRLSLGTASHTPVRTFLIADIRGYTRFTEQCGDELAARLSAKFADLVREGAELRAGTLIEVRGDEALVVFDSARQAIRAAMDLQKQFVEETKSDPDLPLRVGIGIDSGEAIPLEDGTFRGAALNVAARLCAIAHAGEVLVSDGTSHLAGRLPGVRFIDRGRVHLKGIEDSVHYVAAAREEDTPAKTSSRPRISLPAPKRLGWGLGLGVALIAATTAIAVVYLTGETKGEGGSAAPRREIGTTDARRADVISLIPAGLARNCVKQPAANVGAVETAVCIERAGASGFTPDRWEVSIYPNGAAVRRAYEAERGAHDLAADRGRCNRLTWGGEAAWAHGPDKPGGRRLCYFDGNDAVIVWTHERLKQPTHRDVLAVAREGASDHANLTSWWGYAHHLIGKLE